MEKNKNMPTEKEVGLIGDLLTMEENLYKKAKLYSKITMNTKLSEDLKNLAENHKQRFLELYALL